MSYSKYLEDPDLKLVFDLNKAFDLALYSIFKLKSFAQKLRMAFIDAMV